ncbi:hypothetical protein CLOM_g4932 [Closterium sp. NIES-68]|nr:hypothetical protein CLOM_g4932 [Closterium sp. NIES-68]
MAGEGVPRGATLPVEYRAAEEEDRGTYLFAMKLRRTKSTGDVTKANVTKGDGTKGDVTSNAAATVAGDNGWGDSRRKGRERIGTVFEAEERGGAVENSQKPITEEGEGIVGDTMQRGSFLCFTMGAANRPGATQGNDQPAGLDATFSAGSGGDGPCPRARSAAHHHPRKSSSSPRASSLRATSPKPPSLKPPSPKASFLNPLSPRVHSPKAPSPGAPPKLSLPPASPASPNSPSLPSPLPLGAQGGADPPGVCGGEGGADAEDGGVAAPVQGDSARFNAVMRFGGQGSARAGSGLVADGDVGSGVAPNVSGDSSATTAAVAKASATNLDTTAAPADAAAAASAAAVVAAGGAADDDANIALLLHLPLLHLLLLHLPLLLRKRKRMRTPFSYPSLDPLASCPPGAYSHTRLSASAAVATPSHSAEAATRWSGRVAILALHPHPRMIQRLTSPLPAFPRLLPVFSLSPVSPRPPAPLAGGLQ